MRTWHLAWLVVGLGLLVIVVGGLVHATGSSLACPDWPLCYGSANPPMEGGIFYEHGHRLVAGALVVATLALSFALVWTRWTGTARVWGVTAWCTGIVQATFVVWLGLLSSERSPLPTALPVAVGALALGLIGLAGAASVRSGRLMPALGLLLGELLVIQAGLGGLTVLMRLPMIVSTLHLACSMLFIATGLVLAVRLMPTFRPGPLRDRRAVGFAIAALYAQLILGALVRHTNVGMACGIDIILCNDGLLPRHGQAWLLWAHRMVGVVVAAIIVMVAVRAAREGEHAGRNLIRTLGVGLQLGVVLQVVLGVLTVRTTLGVITATLHLGLGAVLLTMLVVTFLLLGPREYGSAEAQPSGPMSTAHGVA